MRASFIGFSALALAAAATPALAQDAPASDFTLTGSAALVSDYRFRGISQSGAGFKPTPQASATLTHSSGFYASFWSSAIDDYVASGADAELDLIGGYSTTVGAVTLDGGLLYYVYPSAAKGVNTDFLEIYGSAKGTVGPVTVKGGFAYDPKQKGLASGINAKNDNLYVYGELSGTVPDTGFGVAAHIGYSAGRSFLTANLKNYWDGNIGVTYTWKNATFGVSYVDTDAPKGAFANPASGKDMAKSGVVASVTYAF